MNITTKRKEIVTYKDIKVYIAEDGTEFTNKTKCEKYEKKLNSNTYTQEDLVGMIVSDLNDRYNKDEVEEIIKSLESNIISCLTDVKDNKTVTIKPFVGLVITSKIEDEHTKHSYLDGKDYISPKALRVRATYTSHFRKKMADKYTERNV